MFCVLVAYLLAFARFRSVSFTFYIYIKFFLLLWFILFLCAPSESSSGTVWGVGELLSSPFQSKYFCCCCLCRLICVWVWCYLVLLALLGHSSFCFILFFSCLVHLRNKFLFSFCYLHVHCFFRSCFFFFFFVILDENSRRT